MHDANWWLMGLAFVLGLLLTFALTIRRVKREVPVSKSTLAAAGGAAATTAATSTAGTSASESGTAKTEAVQDAPYGAGSARPDADGSGPQGWLVKGNADSMLYHTPDSPSYRQTIAEVWFKDEESAKQGGFSPWHKGKDKK
ncbi:MAG: hypothetical protein ACRDTK_15655 [Mycobacterium sp.]